MKVDITEAFAEYITQLIDREIADRVEFVTRMMAIDHVQVNSPRLRLARRAAVVWKEAIDKAEKT